MSPALLVIITSLALQLLSAFVAIRIIVSTGKRAAGLIMLLVIVLMAFRRAVTLSRAMIVGDIHIDLLAESIACLISLFLFIGTVYMYRLISSLRTLSGLLPICASCHKVRDDKGYWKQIELYVREHSLAEFSHGICPECIAKLYPNYAPDPGLPRTGDNGTRQTP